MTTSPSLYPCVLKIHQRRELVLNSPPNCTSILVRNCRHLTSLVVSSWSLCSWIVSVRSLRCVYDKYDCRLNDFHAPSHADRRTQGGILVTKCLCSSRLIKEENQLFLNLQVRTPVLVRIHYNLTSLVVSPWSLYSVVNLGSVRRVSCSLNEWQVCCKEIATNIGEVLEVNIEIFWSSAVGEAEI